MKELSSSLFEDGTLTLNFSDDLASIQAGKPYIVKWNGGSDINGPVFENVTINYVTAKTETTYVDFIGNFSPEYLEAGDQSKLYLGGNNTLYYPDAAMTINACRAYFQLKGLMAGGSASGINNFVLHIGDESTGIREISDQSDSNVDAALSGSWFTLSGHQLGSKPTAKGVYIRNGKKLVIK